MFATGLLLLFAVLTQSVVAMIAVVAAPVVAFDRSTVTGVMPLSTGWSLVHGTDTCSRLGLRRSFCVVFAYKKC